MMKLSDNLGYYFFANSFWDLFNMIDAVNLVDNMALLNWYWGFYNLWVVQAVFSCDFVARRSDGFFGGVSGWSKAWWAIG